MPAVPDVGGLTSSELPGAGEVAGRQDVAVQRIVGDAGRSLGDGVGSQDEHLCVEILGGVRTPLRPWLRHRETALGSVGLRLYHRVPDGGDHGQDRDRNDHGAVASHGTEHGRLELVRFDAGVLHRLTLLKFTMSVRSLRWFARTGSMCIRPPSEWP